LETLEPNLSKRKRKDKFPQIINLEYFWILGEVVAYPSEFISKESVEEFVSSFNVYSNLMDEFIMVEACDNW